MIRQLDINLAPPGDHYNVVTGKGPHQFKTSK
jgi:hypothetical protein